MSEFHDKPSSDAKAYDLVERTARFGEEIVRFAKSVPRNPVTSPLITQIVRSATSVGANFAEADDASSQREFRHKIGISRKEARETKHWLRMIVAAEPELADRARVHWMEAKELHLILATIFRKQTRRLNGDEIQETPSADTYLDQRIYSQPMKS